jgi:hypothetical protein
LSDDVPCAKLVVSDQKGCIDVRTWMLLTAILGAGCASQPTNPQTASGADPLALTDAGRLAVAKNLNLKLVDKDGQQLFCRSNFVTASHIRRDTTCYTPDQLDKMEAQQQRDLDQFTLRSSAGGIGGVR